MKSSEDISPRVYGPGHKKEKSKVDRNLLGDFLRAEIILGGATMGVGGFYLRATDSYNIVVLGALLVTAGIVRLALTDFPTEEEKSAYPEDRLVFRLATGLSADYFLIKNFNLPGGETIDLLACGPGGIFVFGKLNLRGRLEGQADDEKWTHKPVEEQSAVAISNPFREINRLRSNLRKLLEENDIQTGELNFHSCVVLMKHQVEGPALDHPRLLRLGEAIDYVHEAADRVSLYWETVNEIEDALKSRSHRIK